MTFSNLRRAPASDMRLLLSHVSRNIEPLQLYYALTSGVRILFALCAPPDTLILRYAQLRAFMSGGVICPSGFDSDATRRD